MESKLSPFIDIEVLNNGAVFASFLDDMDFSSIFLRKMALGPADISNCVVPEVDLQFLLKLVFMK